MPHFPCKLLREFKVTAMRTFDVTSDHSTPPLHLVKTIYTLDTFSETVYDLLHHTEAHKKRIIHSFLHQAPLINCYAPNTGKHWESREYDIVTALKGHMILCMRGACPKLHLAFIFLCCKQNVP